MTAGLAQLDRARGFLEAMRFSEGLLQQMQDRAVVLEAHYTTHIEGTQLTLPQSEKLMAGVDVLEAGRDDSQELLNYRTAFELVAKYLESRAPITEGLVREIHARLVSEVRGNSAAPGEYRKVQNYVVNSSTGSVIYTPPEAFMVPQLMAELVEWLAHEDELHPILVAGMAQFQLVDIHPFLDGNGRTARLLATLCLYRSGYDFKRLFTLSEFYDRDRAEYYRVLQQVRDSGMELTAWLEYFIEGLVAQVAEAEKSAKRAVGAAHADLTERELQVLALAADLPSFVVADLEARHPKVSRRTWQRDLKSLIDKGLISQSGSTNRRIYQLVTNL